jgi:hypothetical protein
MGLSEADSVMFAEHKPSLFATLVFPEPFCTVSGGSWLRHVCSPKREFELKREEEIRANV